MGSFGATDEARPAPSPPSRTETTVLVVDDSPVVRQLVSKVISDEPGMRVVGEATDGRQAVTLARTLRPDVMILDLVMPGMDGFETLQALRSQNLSTRVVIFANVTTAQRDRVGRKVRTAGAELVIKPTGVSGTEEALLLIRDRLVGTLRQISAAMKTSPPRRASGPIVLNAVVLASSTGGPNALEKVFSGVGELRVPVFVVQHIPDGFSSRLAGRLNTICPMPVTEAVDGQRPEPGHVYLSPGGIHLTVEREGRVTVMRLRDLPPVNSCRPSADVLFRSSAEIYGANQLAVVLTGIGQDGLDGCRELSRLGAPVIVQDEETSVVWGMPGAVATAGIAEEVLPIETVGPRIERLTSLRPVRDRRAGKEES